MPSELTPFADGEGYLEHGENGLTPPQRNLLGRLADGETRPRANTATYRVLQDRGLLGVDQLPTARGRELAAFMRRPRHAN